jgi:hypothetical protein
MLSGSKLWLRACWPLLSALLVGLLVVTIGQRKSRSATSAGTLDDDWDIPRLVAYLNGKGLELRLVSTQKDGAEHRKVFLTTTDKEWLTFNSLPKNQQRMDEWQGTLYCVRGPEDTWPDLIRQWGDYGLIVGPFLFYGDRELLGRVRAALTAQPSPAP